MTYLYVRWNHSFSEEPVSFYSELDAERWEKRKIEVMADGTACCYEAVDAETGAGLSLEPIPPIEEIAQDVQFLPQEITKEEFEQVWKSVSEGYKREFAPQVVNA